MSTVGSVSYTTFPCYLPLKRVLAFHDLKGCAQSLVTLAWVKSCTVFPEHPTDTCRLCSCAPLCFKLMIRVVSSLLLHSENPTRSLSMNLVLQRTSIRILWFSLFCGGEGRSGSLFILNFLSSVFWSYSFPSSQVLPTLVRCYCFPFRWSNLFFHHVGLGDRSQGWWTMPSLLGHLNIRLALTISFPWFWYVLV